MVDIAAMGDLIVRSASAMGARLEAGKEGKRAAKQDQNPMNWPALAAPERLLALCRLHQRVLVFWRVWEAECQRQDRRSKARSGPEHHGHRQTGTEGKGRHAKDKTKDAASKNKDGYH
jgi:hypothetical protein